MATNHPTVFYRDALIYCAFRVLFFGKRNAGNIDFFSPLYWKIVHLTAKSKFTRLVFVEWNGFGIKMFERLGLSGKGSGVTEGYDKYKRVDYYALRLLIRANKLIY